MKTITNNLVDMFFKNIAEVISEMQKAKGEAMVKEIMDNEEYRNQLFADFCKVIEGKIKKECA